MARVKADMEKVAWSGRVAAVQPRIRLLRSFDERHHSYGPKCCSFYRAGPRRKVPGRKGMSYTAEDWVDEEATSHRGPDD